MEVVIHSITSNGSPAAVSVRETYVSLKRDICFRNAILGSIKRFEPNELAYQTWHQLGWCCTKYLFVIGPEMLYI